LDGAERKIAEGVLKRSVGAKQPSPENSQA
jgi:hypothetical protein